MTAQPRLYNDLAWVWELMVAGEDYRSEAELVAETLVRHLRSGGHALLDVGCGAGHHDLYLKEHFQVTGLDASPAMLELARRRNPGLSYHLGDMRGFRLRRRFDAVVILDAIAYNTTYAQLEATLAGCRDHLKPGGALLFYLEEAFTLKPHRRRNETVVSTYGGNSAEVVLVENVYDPNPDDTEYEHTFIYLVRRAGKLDVEIDQHHMGLYELAEVEHILARLGLQAHRSRWPFGGAGGLGQGPLFVCQRTGAPAGFRSRVVHQGGQL
jgi:SAM-dependent methyltransferase